MSELAKRVLPWVVGSFLAYLWVTSTVYRFQHPEMSETELFISLVDALLWR